jgi:predicted phage baseplate assembly protein
MPLPTPNLDDLRFQRDLVDEARRRIVRYCPEWTDYNLSDPGITLIELFAWMTEMLVYRLNRVPEKNYIEFLELLGIQLQPASSARAPLTFRLSAPFPLGPEDDTTTTVPQGTEVATWATEEEPEIIFTTDRKLAIAPPQLIQVRRETEFNRNYLSRLGVEDCYAFGREQPEVGDTFYLGFDDSLDISGYILRLAFEARETQAPGIRREDPPLVWECSLGSGRWEEVPVSTRRGERDTTGGLNNERGSLVLYMPLGMVPDQVHGRSAYWLRCRLEPRHEGQGMYAQSPRIRAILPFALGGTVWATHAQIVPEEVLGRSNGEPGQVLRLQHAPVLGLQAGEHVEVEEERDEETVFVPWERVPDFSLSDIHDRHFTLDEATGEARFGPCIRQPNGAMRWYGRVPEAGRAIRMSRYRHGGGALGNVPADKLQVLRSAIPYIDRVTNLRRASGGRAQESLEEARMRAQREIRAQQRAVTAEDFESLAKQASRAVARVKCNSAGEIAPSAGSGDLPPGMVDLLVVPAVSGALGAGDLSSLAIDQPLIATVRSHLDRYRLLTTTIHIREPRYLGIRVRIEIATSEFHQPEPVVERVRELLRLFIAPLPIDTEDARLQQIIGSEWEGWPFGRDLYVSEIYSLVQQVAGVKHVLNVQLGQRPVLPARESLSQEATHREDVTRDGVTSSPDEDSLEVSDQRVISVPADTLLCLLSCEVEVVSL